LLVPQSRNVSDLDDEDSREALPPTVDYVAMELAHQSLAGAS